MNILTELETETLTKLLQRAIAHGQLQLRIQSIGDDGLGGIGERYDGHGSSDFRWTVESTMASGEEPDDPDNEKGGWHNYEQPEVHLFITDDSAQYLAGNRNPKFFKQLKKVVKS